MHRRPELVGRRQCWYEREVVIGVKNLVERSQSRERAVIAIYIYTIDRYWIFPFLTNNFTKIPRRLEYPIPIPSCLNQVSTPPRLALLPPLPQGDVELLLPRAHSPLLAPRPQRAQPSLIEKRSRALLILQAFSPTVWSKKVDFPFSNLFRATSEKLCRCIVEGDWEVRYVEQMLDTSRLRLETNRCRARREECEDVRVK